MSRQRSNRWGVGLVGTLTLTGFGLLFSSPALLTGAVIPLTYVLYGLLSTVPAEPGIAVTRQFDRPKPSPGEAVGVTLVVENTGESVLTDLRLVDGVPDELGVTDGSPRAGLALSPGESRTLTYTVVAKRGDYTFDDPVIRLRSLAGSERETLTVECRGEDRLTCANAVTDPPLREASLPRAGTLPTDSGGSGLEFYATRQYQSGDPMNRVDWRHVAKTGDFVTVQYREEQAIRTVIVVDARPVGRVTPRPGYPTGAELGAYAAERLYDALDRAGVVAGVTAVGVEQGGLDGLVGPDGLPWVSPEAGHGRQAHARTVLRTVQDISDQGGRSVETTAPAGAATDGGHGGAVGAPSGPKADPDETTRRLLARLPPDTQVVLCTPLVDNWPVSLARSLAVRGFPQVVVSPDVAGSESGGQRVTAVQRRLRIQELERLGATTVSWHLDQPIDYALRLSLPHLLSQR
jgi:uncharacterized protein (DUF58 family)